MSLGSRTASLNRRGVSLQRAAGGGRGDGKEPCVLCLCQRSRHHSTAEEKVGGGAESKDGDREGTSRRVEGKIHGVRKVCDIIVNYDLTFLVKVVSRCINIRYEIPRMIISYVTLDHTLKLNKDGYAIPFSVLILHFYFFSSDLSYGSKSVSQALPSRLSLSSITSGGQRSFRIWSSLSRRRRGMPFRTGE